MAYANLVLLPRQQPEAASLEAAVTQCVCLCRCATRIKCLCVFTPFSWLITLLVHAVRMCWVFSEGICVCAHHGGTDEVCGALASPWWAAGRRLRAYAARLEVRRTLARAVRRRHAQHLSKKSSIYMITSQRCSDRQHLQRRAPTAPTTRAPSQL